MKRIYTSLAILLVLCLVFIIPGTNFAQVGYPFASATTNGILRATDWVLFNGGVSGCGTLGGDLSGTCSFATVTKVNGAALQHTVTFVINNSAGIATGALGVFPPAAVAGTINKVVVTGAPSGSITVDIWKLNGAIPTATNKISASDPATLSSAQYSSDTTLSGWTTSVAVGDVFGGTIVTATSVTSVTITIYFS